MKGNKINVGTKAKATYHPAVSFIGLNAYSEDQASMFFGRDKEIDTLTNLVKTSNLTLLFGKSGTGKTSLLNAGVFPLLRQDYCMPFRIRLEFEENSADIITQIKQVLKTEIDKYGFNVKTYPGDETLWEYFHREPLWKIITPVLVFDQFEEIFTLAGKSSQFTKDDLHVFVEEMSSVIENSVPKKLVEKYVNNNEHIQFLHTNQTAKIIFSFREDFLAEFESFSAQIPSIKNSRFRLMPMNGQQAFDVITKTWGTAIHHTEANKVVYFLTEQEQEKGKKGNNEPVHFDSLVIEPSLLSQVCAFIDREKKREGLKQVSAGFLRKYPKGKILRTLYEEVLMESESLVLASKPGDKNNSNRVKEFIEDNLITDEGYRSRYITAKVDKAILPGITLLTRKYYLREDAESIELTHDVIVALVKNDREKRRKALALIEAKRKANRKAIIVVLFAALFAFGLWWFVTHKAREKNEELIADNELLERKKDDLRKDSARLANDIEQNLKLLGGPGSKGKGGGVDSTRHSGGAAMINGLNIDSIKTVIAGLQDSLQATKMQLRRDLEANIVAKKKLETDIQELKIRHEEERKLLSLNKGEAVIKLNEDLQKRIDENKELQLKLKKVENDFNSLKVNTDTKIISLQAQISSLEDQLKKYRRRFDPRVYPLSDEKIFGYGYDYAEEKVKRKRNK